MTSVKQIAYGMKTLYVERYDRGCILTAEGIPVNDYTREVYRVISMELDENETIMTITAA